MVHGDTGVVHTLNSTNTMPLQVPSHRTCTEAEASFTTTLMEGIFSSNYDEIKEERLVHVSINLLMVS